MRLKKSTRDALPNSAFAGKGRTYPVEDKAHARAAIGLSAMHHASGRDAIVAKAKEVLRGKGK